MEIGVINCSGGSELAFTYGLPHQGTINYLNSKMQQFSNTLADIPLAVRGMFDDVKRSFDSFFSDEAIADARKALQSGGSEINVFIVAAMLDTISTRNANIINQRWIMAEPTLRAMYHKQQVDGYSGSYVDVEPDVIGDRHYDYRRAVTGLIRDDESGDMLCEIFTDELLEGDQELNIRDQTNIQLTWDFLRAHLRQKLDSIEDPTDRDGGFL